MHYARPEYLVETAWLQAHLDDPGLRVVDCTHYLPNYFDESAGRHIEKLSGRRNHEYGHIPGSVFVDLRDDAEDAVRRICEDARAAGDDAGPSERLVGDLYASFLDEDAVEAAGTRPLEAPLARVEITGPPSQVAAIDKASSDLRASGRITGELVLTPDEHATDITVTAELAETA